MCSFLPVKHQEALAVAYAMLNPPMEKEKSFHLLTLARNVLLPGHPLDWPELAWCDSQAFYAYLTRFDELHGHNASRKWMLSQLLRLTDHVPGDTCECGVYRGASSWLICQRNAEISTFQRIHHIFDSFEGLSEPEANQLDDDKHWKKGALAAGEDVVIANLGNIAPYQLYKGWIPTQFHQVDKVHFSFVHVDVDLYQPTKDSIEFFYPRISNGGIFLCDDYFYNNCAGATKACDDYLSDKPEKMIPVSSGGGFFIKGQATGKNLFSDIRHDKLFDATIETGV